MSDSAVALVIPLAVGEEPAIEVVADDIDSCTQVYFEPEPSIVDMIEQERCPLADGRHDDGLHLYLDGQNACCRCAMAAPWVRRDACRS